MLVGPKRRNVPPADDIVGRDVWLPMIRESSANTARMFSRLLPLLALGAAVSPKSAPAQNLIPDPTFSFGVSAWKTRGALPSKVEWIGSAGADGATGFGRLTALTGGPGAFFANVCVPVQSGVAYSWGGFLHFATAPNAGARFTVDFFADSACAGPFVLLHVIGPQLPGGSADPNTWYSSAGPDVVAPATAASAALEVQISSLANSSTAVDFDNVYFGSQGTGPPLIVSVPMLSTSALLLLGTALAAAGVWRLANR
jgi:hypothetical protein